MFKRRYIILILIVFLSVYSLYAHNPWTTLEHTAFSKFLEGTNAALTCNFEGRTFTRTTYYYSDGYIHSTAWYPSLTTPSMKIASKGHGLGFAQVKLYGNIDGKSVGSSSDWSPAIEIGWYVPGVAYAGYGHDVDVSAEHSGIATTSEGTHHWDGSGTIQYTPYYYDSINLFAGKWQNGATWSTSDAKPDGSWKIKYNDEILSYPKYPGSGSSTSPSEPSDNTPNCQDCTSDCSSPCSCTNSGTCGGAVTTPPPAAENCSCVGSQRRTCSHRWVGCDSCSCR